MPIALLLLLLVGGGTGIAAENSLPGDVLYPVKIHINENLESAIAIGAKADAEVSVRQAARRLAEAERLKEKGDISSKQSKDIKDAFLDEVLSINKNLKKIKEKGDREGVDKVSREFEKELKDHNDIFVLINGTSSARVSPEIQARKFLDDESSDDNDDVKKSGIVGGKDYLEKWKGDDGDDDEGDDDDDKEVTNTLPRVSTPTNVITGSSGSNTTTSVKYTLNQVATHNKSSDCWSVVNGGVYNLTSWIAQHPGGASAIVGMCGRDATRDFVAQHGGQGNPENELASFKIGVLQ